MKSFFPALALAAVAVTSQLSAQTSTEPADHSSSVKSNQPTESIRASKLLGVSVTSKEGENLGQVQDLIFNPRTGKIRFALIGHGFMAGTVQKMIPVPWKAVNVRSQREFAVNVDKNKLQTAPEWSQLEEAQPDYIIRVYRFYEIEPEPQTDVGGPGQADQQQGTGEGSSTEPEDSNQKQPQDSDSSTQPK